MFTNPTNPIQQENNEHGTEAWMLDPPVSCEDVEPLIEGVKNGGPWVPCNRTRCLEGFASATSVNIGEALKFYVSTTAPEFTMRIYRMGYYDGAGGREMTKAHLGPFKGVDQTDPGDPPSYCSHWTPVPLPGGALTIPSTWVSGVYVVKLATVGAAEPRESYIIFVVRDDAREATYLMQLSVTTYQAYN